MDDKLKYAQEVANKLKEIGELEDIKNLVVDGKVEWDNNNETYRVRKPTQREKKEVERLRNEKYIELLKNNKYLFRDQLIEIYKEKDIDIKAMDDSILANQKQQMNLEERLATITDKQTVDLLEKEIHGLRITQSLIKEEKGELLKYCIEQQLINFMNEYFSYLLFEKSVNGNWVRVFSSYDDFLNADGDSNELLITQAVYYLSCLVFKDAL
jgi:uncharacterized protein YbcC (UPF0753/DUF2309 family)